MVNMTQADAVYWVNTIYTSPFDFDNTNFSYAQGGDPQCVDLVKYYFSHLGYPIGSIGNSGYAYDLRNNYNVYTHYLVIDNNGTTPPEPGDVFVNNAYCYGAGFTGHTGIVTYIDSDRDVYGFVDWNGAGGRNKAGSGERTLYGFSYLIRPLFISPDPPAAPVISANRDYLLDNETITITWGGVSGTAYYEYYLTAYPEGYAYTNFTDHGTLTVPSVTFYGPDLKNGHYSFFVHGANSAGWSPQSNWIEFDVYASDYVPVVTEVYDGHIYALYDLEMAWSFARDLCADMGGHLLTINDAAEQAYVETLINKGSKYGYWLGGTNFTTTETDVNGPYRWVTKEAFSYTNWGAGEPNFSGERGTRERFAEIRRDNNGKWNDAYNTNRSGRGFILEIEPAEEDIAATGSFKGSRYMILDRNTTWTEAQARCEMLGGHLVTIDSKEEGAYIDSLIKAGKRSWYYLGGRLEAGNWMWVNGTAVDHIERDSNWTAWGGSYLMKYKGSLACLPIGNTYYPAHDIENIGFICEIDGVSAESVELNHHELLLCVGDTDRLHATVTPSDAVDEVYWHSSDPSVVSVTDTGKLKAMAAGEATITAAAGDFSDTCLVTVKEASVVIRRKTWTPAGDGTVDVSWNVEYNRSYSVPFKVLAAQYGEDGRMLSVQVQTLTPAQGDNLCTATFDDVEGSYGWAYCIVENGDPIAKAARLGGKEILSKWVLEKDVPAGAEIAKEKWTYTLTETRDSYQPELEGWSPAGSEWVRTTTKDAHVYAPLPGGFSPDHALYGKYDSQPYQPESGTNEGIEWKTEVVSTGVKANIYWHWTWNWSERAGGNYNVFVEDHYCTENGREYSNFRAFESSEAYGHADPNGVDGGECFYAWLGDAADGSWWWFRTPVYREVYARFEKMYHFERVTTGLESDAEVVPGDGVSDVQHWVKYVID